jgi:hypothetical protein
MSGGSHSHGGGSSGAHSHSTGGGGVGVGGGCVIAFLLLAALAAILGIPIYHAVVGAVDNSHDKNLNRQDMLIRSAKLTVECHEIYMRHGVVYTGPRCSSANRSGALVMELKSLPAGISIVGSGSRGQYVARCSLLDSSRTNLGDSTGTALITKRSTAVIGDFVEKKIVLPGNACAVWADNNSASYVEIDISRVGATDNLGSSAEWTIRQIETKISSAWYIANGIG